MPPARSQRSSARRTDRISRHGSRAAWPAVASAWPPALHARKREQQLADLPSLAV